jgi:hypothetical protein
LSYPVRLEVEPDTRLQIAQLKKLKARKKKQQKQPYYFAQVSELNVNLFQDGIDDYDDEDITLVHSQKRKSKNM